MDDDFHPISLHSGSPHPAHSPDEVSSKGCSFARRRKPRLKNLLGAALSLALLSPSAASQKVEVICHRGLSSQAPENTLPALERAIQAGCDAVEVDLRTTRDGVVVLMHDSTIDRTTNGQGKVAQLDYEEIRALDAGGWFSDQFRGAHVPTLEEAITLAKGRARLYLDIKARNFKAITGIVRKHAFSSSVYYRAYLPADIRRIRGLDPSAQIVFDLDRLTSNREIVESVLNRHPGIILSSQMANWNSQILQRMHSTGTSVFINLLGQGIDEGRFRQALSAAPQGILTDEPGVLLELLGRKAPE